MGLTMYLTRKYLISKRYGEEIKGSVEVYINGELTSIALNRLGHISEEVVCWRKANAIHGWFIDNVQDKQDDHKVHQVDSCKLRQLLELCKKVLSKAHIKTTDGRRKIGNVKEISRLLPTIYGSYYGDTDYADAYIADLEYTIRELSAVLQEDEEFHRFGIATFYEYLATGDDD